MDFYGGYPNEGFGFDEPMPVDVGFDMPVPVSVHMPVSPMMLQVSPQMLGMYNYGYRVTRGNALEDMRTRIMQGSGVMIQREVKLPEPVESFRHACAEVGLSLLQPYDYKMQLSNGSVFSARLFFCNRCGTLYYYEDTL